MRKLKLQVQVSVDGFMAGPNGEMDWMTWNWDDALKDYVDALTKPVDTILLGRKMADGFISHWTSLLTRPEDESYPFAKKMVDSAKVVFTKTLSASAWTNTNLATGDITEEVNQLKKERGGDMIVYGGAGFVSSLIKADLINEYNLFVNPAAIGNGLSLFNKLDRKHDLQLVRSIPFECGIVLMQYHRNA
jgi:dihydrofolate reductase